LLSNLFNHGGTAVHDKSDTGIIGRFAAANGNAVNIKTAPSEEANHTV